MNDQQTEALIKERGADVAPRVTPAQIESVIASEHYFTAADGVAGEATNAPHIDSPDALAEAISRASDCPQVLGLLTICVLVLRNGFTVIGESACASPENFDAAIGRKVARGNALQKIWPVEGYLLRQRLNQQDLIEALLNPMLTDEGRARIHRAVESGDQAAIEMALSSRNCLS